jgi:hypothetical protein
MIKIMEESNKKAKIREIGYKRKGMDNDDINNE